MAQHIRLLHSQRNSTLHCLFLPHFCPVSEEILEHTQAKREERSCLCCSLVHGLLSASVIRAPKRPVVVSAKGKGKLWTKYFQLTSVMTVSNHYRLETQDLVDTTLFKAGALSPLSWKPDFMTWQCCKEVADSSKLQVTAESTFVQHSSMLSKHTSPLEVV